MLAQQEEFVACDDTLVNWRLLKCPKHSSSRHMQYLHRWSLVLQILRWLLVTLLLRRHLMTALGW